MKQWQQSRTGVKQVTILRPGGLNVLESGCVDVLAGVLPVFDDTGQVKLPRIKP